MWGWQCRGGGGGGGGGASHVTVHTGMAFDAKLILKTTHRDGYCEFDSISHSTWYYY